MNLPINEIFNSIQGEGSFTGTPSVFVRLQFCGVGCSFCFVGNTQISMGTGAPKNIKDVKVGDIVVAFDEKTKLFVKKKVTKTFVSKTDKLLKICTGSDPRSGNTGDRVICTSEHPFLVKNKGWVQAQNIKVGDILLHLSVSDKMRLDNPRHNPNVYFTPMSQEQREISSRRMAETMSRPEVKAKIKKRMTENNPMKDPAIAAKSYLAREAGGKTGLEKLVESVCDGLPIVYCGDGKQFSVAHKFPDFRVDGQNKLIEVWASDSLWAQVANRDHVWVEKRKNLFSKHGYETLFLPLTIQDLSKANLPKIREQVSDFINNGEVVTALVPIEKGTNKAWVRLAGLGKNDVSVYNLEVEDCHTYIANGKIVHNCDTKHTWDKKDSEVIPFAEMLGKAKDSSEWADTPVETLVAFLAGQPERHIVITGGEPCMYDLTELTAKLLAFGKSVQIETSGTSEIKAHDGVFITLSPKIGMPGGLKVLMSAAYLADEIKMPVGKMKDVETLETFLSQRRVMMVSDDDEIPVYLQPLSQSEKSTELCIEQARQNGWRLSAQLHKYLKIR